MKSLNRFELVVVEIPKIFSFRKLCIEKQKYVSTGTFDYYGDIFQMILTLGGVFVFQ